MAANDRFFVVGETVHLRTRVSKPGTRQPDDADVLLTRLQREGSPAEVIDNPVFTRQSAGDYTYVIQTALLAPGTYDLTVTISSGPERVVIATDRFVLKTA